MKTLFFVANLIVSAVVYGQSTLPSAVFTNGAIQTPLIVDGLTSKEGVYGYLISQGVPRGAADSDSASLSTLRLFEIWPDGSVKELGSGHSRHADIRSLGGGRFSHWLVTATNKYYLYFSASDATDPRSNGRHYLAVQPINGLTNDLVGSLNESQSGTKKYYLQTLNPANKSLLITNPANYAYNFTVALNQNGFLQSLADLKSEIQNRIPEFSGEPIERKIWRFVRDNRFHDDPYTVGYWYHHPLLMFNSAGWGYCDDAASVLMHTAKLFGIDARVWALNSPNPRIGGHIVPEVYTNGSWHLYDPDYETYYVDSAVTKNVASVSKLISNISLITNPLQTLPFMINPQLAFGYPSISEGYASYYNSAAMLAPWYNPLLVTEAPLTFNLPPKGKIEIGARRLNDAPNTFIDGIMASQPVYSSVNVTLPEGAVGKLQVFLIPYMIKGNGSVTLQYHDNSQETVAISATSKWNVLEGSYRSKYIKSVSYTAGSGGLVVSYLAHRNRSSLKQFNSVVLKPSGSTATTTVNPLLVGFQTVQ